VGSQPRADPPHPALDAVEKGEADALVVAKLDRLSRSMKDFGMVLERHQKRGWSLIALDVGVDTSTPSGEAMAHMLATFARYERRPIGERTNAALAVRKEHGTKSGKPIGRPAYSIRWCAQDYGGCERRVGATGALPTT
jgi:DNA invertase Pin-like site-specific DNA recombinase